MYTGTDFSHTIPGKASEGMFYYRVRAVTQYGLGPWYSLGLASVQIIPQGGTTGEGGAEINTPIPGDEQ